MRAIQMKGQDHSRELTEVPFPTLPGKIASYSEIRCRLDTQPEPESHSLPLIGRRSGGPDREAPHEARALGVCSYSPCCWHFHSASPFRVESKPEADSPALCFRGVWKRGRFKRLVFGVSRSQ